VRAYYETGDAEAHIEYYCQLAKTISLNTPQQQNAE
jgi:hypothetical protein